MGLWGRIQVNGALQRLGKRIAANPYLWQVASDNRPHFDHWVEDHASDGDLIRAGAELKSFLYEIPPRDMARKWGQQIATIVEGSAECVRREILKRGLTEGEAHGGESDRGTTRALTSTEREETVAYENPDPARQSMIELYQETLKLQRKKFAGKIHTDTDERSVRLTTLLEATLEIYRSQPSMDAALNDPSSRRNVVDNLTVEYMPLLFLDPDELPRTFAEYLLWKFGNDEAIEQPIDTEYLKGAFELGLSRLPDGGRERFAPDRFEWGKLL